MASPRRLALVIHGLSGGGAERVLADMANHWVRLGDHVTLITLAAADTDVYTIEPAVQRVGLDVMQDSRGPLAAVTNNMRRIFALRRAIREARPDFVISFTDQINVLALVATLGTRQRVVVCERSDPRHHPLGRAWSMLRRRFYRRCFAAVVQTEAVHGVVQPFAGRRPVYVIPNSVNPQATRVVEASGNVAASPSDRACRLVAMGRLSVEKGFDLLVDAFASIADRHPNWTLDIFGDGPLQAELQQQVARLDLSERVRLPGWTDDPLAEFTRADLFVLSSHYEGFPNALLDAMACGLPAVSFDCQSGPAEIMRHNVDGLLAEAGNAEALADAIHRLMSDELLRREFGERATEVVDRFSVERFYARWEAVFEAAATDDGRFATTDRKANAD